MSYGDVMQESAVKQWYLIQCKPRQDFRALEQLQHQGYECLLPRIRVERLKNGQLKNTEEPLFPGYLFISLDILQDSWMPIRSTRGVSQIVRFGATPSPVPSTVIDRVREQERIATKILQPGDKILIDYKGNKGLEAIFLAKDGSKRVLMLLRMLSRDVTVGVTLTS